MMMKQKSFWKARKIVGGVLGTLALLAVLPAAANAYPRPGITERVSVAPGGAQGSSDSYYSVISADGRYVAFTSDASNLVPGDTNGGPDVFVHDRQTGATERISVASNGAQADASSYSNFTISADGRYVAFGSEAPNLVPGDTNLLNDVFVHDRQTGATERVSVASNGAQAFASSFYSAISADGRYVGFATSAPLVPGDTNQTTDVFVHDRVAGTTERVSVASDGTQNGASNRYSLYPALSADGRYVAFASSAANFVSLTSGDPSNLPPGDNNTAYDIFVHDRVARTTERVSVASDGTESNFPSQSPAISADGRYVAFESIASNLVPADTNGRFDVFLHDRATGATERVSVASDGVQANNYSDRPAISADGRYVSFTSRASNLVPGDTNGGDVFVHDRVTGATERVSLASNGAQANAVSDYPDISADGRYVAFHSSASNLVPGDTNGALDVFVHDRGRLVGVGDLTAVPGEDRVSVSGSATFSGAVVSATDPPADGVPGSGPAGAELTGASLSARPEQGDLLVRLRLASLPSPNGAGAPAVLWGMRFRLGVASYEVRALRGVITDASAAPTFLLYRCDPGCTQQAALTGGIGTTGTNVSMSVPYPVLGVQEGAVVEGIVAFSALGEEGQVPLDQVDLPATTIPVRQVSLGIAPTGTTEEEVAFDTEAAITGGSFAGTLDVGSFSAGDYEVWARACLGEVCGAAARTILG